MYELVDNLSLLTGASVITILAISTLTDVTGNRIPNVLLLPALVLAIALQVVFGGFDGLLSAFGGLGLGLALLLPLYTAGGMGAGDVKLLGVIGAFLGPEGVMIAGLGTFIAGAILALLFVGWRIAQPALEYAGYRLALLYKIHGTPVSPAQPSRISVRRERIAYAPAIAAGTFFAMWQQGLLIPLSVMSG